MLCPYEADNSGEINATVHEVGGRDCVTGLENFNRAMVVARRTPRID
jgi:hypothetical protein